MTVKELMEVLQKFDSEKEIKISARDFRDYVDEEYLDDDYAVYSDSDITEIYEDKDNSIILRCE